MYSYSTAPDARVLDPPPMVERWPTLTNLRVSSGEDLAAIPCEIFTERNLRG